MQFLVPWEGGNRCTEVEAQAAVSALLGCPAESVRIVSEGVVTADCAVPYADLLEERNVLHTRCQKLEELLQSPPAPFPASSGPGSKELRYLSNQTRLLEAELHDVKSELSRKDRLHREVMETVKDLKSQVSFLTDALLESFTRCKPSDGEDSEDAHLP